jgi:hypothetical protein
MFEIFPYGKHLTTTTFTTSYDSSDNEEKRLQAPYLSFPIQNKWNLTSIILLAHKDILTYSDSVKHKEGS